MGGGWDLNTSFWEALFNPQQRSSVTLRSGFVAGGGELSGVCCEGIERREVRASTGEHSSQETRLTGALECLTGVRNPSSEPSSTKPGVAWG